MFSTTRLVSAGLSQRGLSGHASRFAWRSARTYATESQWPKAPPPKDLPPPESFSGTARPRPYHRRQERDLPPLERRWPILLAFATVGISAWGLFLAWSENQERLSSSVMRQVMDIVRDSPELKEVLGEAIRPEPVWWLNGDPWITGSIRLMQGNVDLSFRLKGHKRAGTLYFTSIRKAKGEPFTILRFKVIADDGTTLDVPGDSM
ncbi:hypothetical protein FOMPIDRAFT_45528 [Fomitopsis schrenkii]|uniref:DUF1783-domain-containing protein n=1 Tax=Fomitopsis schrenkii TaxID=2126942 RepID=S8FEJ9_FOMSC|nr:hypothetical protein FOMPIDRAFT_45528 [Fomitopsis schrenkii]